jgi:hypothetical protein
MGRAAERHQQLPPVRGILLFAPLYLGSIRFALFYYDFNFLPLFTLVNLLFALFNYFLCFEDLGKMFKTELPLSFRSTGKNPS